MLIKVPSGRPDSTAIGGRRHSVWVDAQLVWNVPQLDSKVLTRERFRWLTLPPGPFLLTPQLGIHKIPSEQSAFRKPEGDSNP